MTGEVLARFPLALEVVVRPAREGDLEPLEWFGMFTPHRELIRDAFQRQERGEVVMLVAEANGFPVGQVWIDLTRRAAASVGFLVALRVLPVFQGCGIGSRLLEAADRVTRERGLRFAELGVEKDNPRARKLYERIGYRVVGEEREEYSYTPPGGSGAVRVPVDEWILRKTLDSGGEASHSEGTG